MTGKETITQETLLKVMFELESENERLHDAFDKMKAEIMSKVMVETTSERQFYNMALQEVLQIIDKYRK